MQFVLRYYLASTILLLFLCMPAHQASSQDKWSLERCINYAIVNNIQVRQSAINKALDEQDLLQSKLGALPNLNGFASHVYNFGQTIDPFTNQFATERVQSNNFSLNSSINIFNGFQTLNSIKRNQSDLAASNYELEAMKKDISLNVANLYLQILFNKELLINAQNQKQISIIQRERVAKLVQVGSEPSGALLDIEAQIANEELQIIQAKNQHDLARLNLVQLLNIQDASNFEIENPSVSDFEEGSTMLAAGVIYEAAVREMPLIKAAEFRLLSAEKTLSIAKGGIGPSLTLNGSAGTGFSGARKEIVEMTPTPIYRIKPFDEQLDENFNYSIGLTLNIPIFNGWSARSNINRAKLNLQNSELILEDEKLRLRQNIESAHQDAVAALNSYYAAKKSVIALRESFGYTEERFKLGMINSFEFNNEKNKLINAESELVQAKYEYIFKTKVLDFYQGKKLGF